MEDILVPIALFVMIAAIVLGAFYAGIVKQRARIHAIEKIIDSGQTLTPELLKTIEQTIGAKDVKRSALTRGVQQILVGVALSVFFFLGYISEEHMPLFLVAVGLFPFASGAALVAGHYAAPKTPAHE